MNEFFSSGIRFECQPDCSACCRLSGGFVYLNEQEAEAIARYLGADTDEFKETFTREIDGVLALVDGEEEACVFLEGHRCLIYEVRPLQCRMFPFWPENLHNERTWAQTRQICPGIGSGRLYSADEIERLLALQEHATMEEKRKKIKEKRTNEKRGLDTYQ